MIEYFNNQKGSLAYVIMIVVVLLVMVPSILMMTSDSDLTSRKSESEKKATELAVSGMQAFASYPGAESDKINYLKTNDYGWTTIHLPEGSTIEYGQYVVESTVPDSDVLNNIVPVATVDSNKSYKIVVAAIAGDLDSDRQQDIGEKNYFVKRLIRGSTAASGQYTQITATPSSSQAGYNSPVAVSISTIGFPDQTSFIVELVTSSLSSLPSAVTATGTITTTSGGIGSGSALINIPDTVATGNYILKITANSISDINTPFTISTTAPTEAQAFTYINGVQQTFTKADLESSTLTTITTTGSLYIPESYGTINTATNTPVNYTAPSGIFIGAGIKTQAAGGNIHLRACGGPIVVDGASFITGTGNTDISIESGQYISAKGTTFDAGRDISLTANQYMDVSNGYFNSKNSASLMARSLAEITTSAANFNGKTPSETGNPGNPITCP
jgi:hypothetical protein